MNNFALDDRLSRNPCMPEGEAVYAIGDIHGRLDLVERLLILIGADIRAHPGLRSTIVFLGDFIDRGPASRQVVELLMGGAPAYLGGVGWVCLAGNHEQVLLDFWNDPAAGPDWFHHGGLETVRSYLKAPAPPDWGRDPALVRSLLHGAVPPAHRAFLAGLPLSFEWGDYLFVHAGIRPGVALDRQDPEDLTWIRHEFLNDGRWHGKVVVHGHTPSPKPENLFNRIGVDTGAWMSGHLSAVALMGGTRRFIAT